MQDSTISWVRVPLKYALNNLILSGTNQHQVQFWSRFFGYRFSVEIQIYDSYRGCGGLELVPQLSRR